MGMARKLVWMLSEKIGTKDFENQESGKQIGIREKERAGYEEGMRHS
jgi:hypothetical protein